MAAYFFDSSALAKRYHPEEGSAKVAAIFLEPNPVPIKAALARAGVISSPTVRMPLCEISPANFAELVKALAIIRR